MIIVTVEVPIMENDFDFQIDEDVPFFLVHREMINLICVQNQCEMEGDIDDLIVWDKKRKIQIDMSRTPYENGLETGSELIMV